MNLYLVKRNKYPHDFCVRGASLEEALKNYQAYGSDGAPYSIDFIMPDGPFYDIVGKTEAEIGGVFLDVSSLVKVVGEFVDRELGINRHKKSPTELEGLAFETRRQIETIELKLARAKEFLDFIAGRADMEE